MLSLRKLAYFALFIAYVAGECTIESHRCDFPFQREGEVWYECMPGEENSDRHYCITQLGEKYVTGVCNGGCFEEDGSPVVFNSTSEDAVMAVFCKTKKSPCIFPFIWEGREYRECTTDGDTPFPWCALEVNDAGELVDNRWGQCDMSTCDPVSAADTESEPPKPKSVSVSFKEFAGELVFSQTTPEDALQVEGLLEGLPEDSDLQLAVVQGDCNQDIEQYLESMVDIQGLYEASSSVKAVIWVLSLYPGDQYLVGRSAIIKEQDSTLLTEAGSLPLGRILACAPIEEPSSTLSLTIIIIIVLVAVILLLVIILICICCCCCRNRRLPEKKNSLDSLEDPIDYVDRKTPLYDELSIPFIDASLPPTPKVGRSRDQLAILLGRGSKSSLSNDGD